MDRFSKYIEQGTVEMLRELSDKAIDKLNDECLEWIYIDGDHTYEFALRDLNDYFSKVKPGGYICGDDYLEGQWFDGGVKKAVNEFVAEKKEKIEVVSLIKEQFILKKIA